MVPIWASAEWRREGIFTTDVLWGGGLTYLTGLMLSYVFRFDKNEGFVT